MTTRYKEVNEILEDAGLHDSVWGKRILKACEEGTFSGQDKELAGSWVTCACGEVTAGIPRGKDRYSSTYTLSDEMVPQDAKLERLGLTFFYAVSEGHHCTTAAKLLVEIEARAIEVAGKETH